MPKERFTYPHEADPDIFREALAYSEADKGITSTLIEKDYYCSLVLQYFFSYDPELVFKGGTCRNRSKESDPGCWSAHGSQWNSSDSLPAG